MAKTAAQKSTEAAATEQAAAAAAQTPVADPVVQAPVADPAAAKAAEEAAAVKAAEEAAAAAKAAEEAAAAKAAEEAAAKGTLPKLLIFDTAEEAEPYVKKGYLVRHVHHEGKLVYKVFTSKIVNALGSNTESVSIAKA